MKMECTGTAACRNGMGVQGQLVRALCGQGWLITLALQSQGLGGAGWG